jgi:hypothetical protein
VVGAAHKHGTSRALINGLVVMSAITEYFTFEDVTLVKPWSYWFSDGTMDVLWPPCNFHDH